MASTSESSDGPVLTVLSKRIRNLRKKLNRITQIEQSQKNPIKNKEQQDLILSKPLLVAVIDELEKLRLPLTVAVDEEVKNTVADVTKEKDDVGVTEMKNPEKPRKELAGNEGLGDDVSNGGGNGDDDVSKIEDLLKVIYFGSVFNVKMGRGGGIDNLMMTRIIERNCCLSYDTMKNDDDVAFLLNEGDLDDLGEMSEMLVSRPADSSVSHEEALRRCVGHARNWIAGSEERIHENSDVTYAALREKLAKIIGSEYCKIKPEMKAPADVAAEAAAESYVFVQAETEVEQKQDNAADFQRIETYDGQSSPVDNHPGGEPEAENSLESPVDQVEVQAGGTDNKDQYASRRTHQNQRGGGRNGGGRGNGRSYGNGRGGRSGGRGGPYQNGRNQYNDQQGNYYPRNHGGRGRGGRGNGGGYAGGYNNHASGGAEVAQS